MAISVAFSIAAIIVFIFQCHPIHYFWERRGKGHCVDITKFYLAAASLDMINDVTIIILPLHMVWQLHLPRWQKIALSGAFLVGLL